MRLILQNVLRFCFISFSMHYLLCNADLLSPGSEFCLPSPRLSHSDPAGVQPHKPAMHHQTCHRRQALECCALCDLWTRPKQDIWDHLPTTVHDCWWRKALGREAPSVHSVWQRNTTWATNSQIVNFSFSVSSGIRVFLIPWWHRFAVLPAGNCDISQGRGHLYTPTVCQDSLHDVSPCA